MSAIRAQDLNKTCVFCWTSGQLLPFKGYENLLVACAPVWSDFKSHHPEGREFLCFAFLYGEISPKQPPLSQMGITDQECSEATVTCTQRERNYVRLGVNRYLKEELWHVVLIFQRLNRWRWGTGVYCQYVTAGERRDWWFLAHRWDCLSLLRTVRFKEKKPSFVFVPCSLIPFKEKTFLHRVLKK